MYLATLLPVPCPCLSPSHPGGPEVFHLGDAQKRRVGTTIPLHPSPTLPPPLPSADGDSGAGVAAPSAEPTVGVTPSVRGGGITRSVFPRILPVIFSHFPAAFAACINPLPCCPAVRFWFPFRSPYVTFSRPRLHPPPALPTLPPSLFGHSRRGGATRSVSTPRQADPSGWTTSPRPRTPQSSTPPPLNPQPGWGPRLSGLTGFDGRGGMVWLCRL